MLLSDWARILAAAPNAALTVVGVPGERTRERVRAAVELREGEGASLVHEADLVRPLDRRRRRAERRRDAPAQEPLADLRELVRAHRPDDPGVPSAFMQSRGIVGMMQP